MKKFKIGHGYDVHRLVEGRDLILGGVKIPFELGLLGHSEADALLHAVMDEILGALGEGDIGKHFPDTDKAFKDISSMLLAEECSRLMKDRGYKIGNIDATVIAQKPKLAPYISAMRKNIAAAFSTDEENINVKATTEEKLGFTGNLEGIACHAVVLINSIV